MESIEQLEARMTVIEKEMTQIREMDTNLRESVRDFVRILEGQSGIPGMIFNQKVNRENIQSLMDWRRDMKPFLAGIVVVCTFIGSSFTLILTAIINHLMKLS